MMMMTQHHQHHKAFSSSPPGTCLFVGNLSYFCEEKHLHDLFDQYGHVQQVKIVMNDLNTRSLMFGFVTMASPAEAREMEISFDDHLFMGRRLRVALIEKKIDTKNGPASRGIQVHCSFSSFFGPGQEIVLPTEMLLRKTFTPYGTLLDVSIKEYKNFKEQAMQEGYGFLTFESLDNAIWVSNNCKCIEVNGVTFSCELTHQHNPGAAQKVNKALLSSRSNPLLQNLKHAQGGMYGQTHGQGYPVPPPIPGRERVAVPSVPQTLSLGPRGLGGPSLSPYDDYGMRGGAGPSPVSLPVPRPLYTATNGYPASLSPSNAGLPRGLPELSYFSAPSQSGNQYQDALTTGALAQQNSSFGSSFNSAYLGSYSVAPGQQQDFPLSYSQRSLGPSLESSRSYNNSSGSGTPAEGEGSSGGSSP